MSYTLNYKCFNEHSILIEWPTEINQNILEDILVFKNKVENLNIKSIIEIINTYNSLLVIYNHTIENINNEISTLKTLYSKALEFNFKKSICWEIPVCYDDIFGIDLANLPELLKLSKSEIISRHSSQIYTVYFIGFLPGFLYLGGLDDALNIPRKSTPILNVKKGTVGIGGMQTGIYPQSSPGGWHIIGNSPLDFFNTKDEKPCFAKPGDTIKFRPISKVVYDTISKEIENGVFKINYLIS